MFNSLVGLVSIGLISLFALFGTSSVQLGEIYPADTLVEVLPEVHVFPGEEFLVPVKVGDISQWNVISLQYTLQFNPSVLEFIHTVTGPQCSTDGTSTGNSGNFYQVWGIPGTVNISYANPVPFVGNKTLFCLKFKAIGQVAYESDIVLDNFMFNEGSPSVRVFPGHVKIGNYWVSIDSFYDGDIYRRVKSFPKVTDWRGTRQYSLPTQLVWHTAGGQVAITATKPRWEDVQTLTGITAYDAALIQRCMMGMIECDLPIADVSQDETITAYDAGLVLWYVSGRPMDDTLHAIGEWKFSTKEGYLVDNSNVRLQANIVGDVSGLGPTQLSAADDTEGLVEQIVYAGGNLAIRFSKPVLSVELDVQGNFSEVGSPKNWIFSSSDSRIVGAGITPQQELVIPIQIEKGFSILFVSADESSPEEVNWIYNPGTSTLPPRGEREEVYLPLLIEVSQ